jgi:hypothetical protein
MVCAIGLLTCSDAGETVLPMVGTELQQPVFHLAGAEGYSGINVRGHAAYLDQVTLVPVTGPTETFDDGGVTDWVNLQCPGQHNVAGIFGITTDSLAAGAVVTTIGLVCRDCCQVSHSTA